jgi:two-component system alkaline phosphatase synthesis response regulator PhoP
VVDASNKCITPCTVLAIKAWGRFWAEESRVPEKILVVEDEQDLRELVGKYFGEMGYRVVVAADGADALDLAKQERPQIILLDLKMPEVDGLEICKKLKADERTRNIPIIIVTAYNNQLNEALAAGADDFVAKPVHLLELSVRVKSILKVRHLTDELEKSVAYMKELQKNLPGVDTGHWRRAVHAQATTPKVARKARKSMKR